MSYVYVVKVQIEKHTTWPGSTTDTGEEVVDIDKIDHRIVGLFATEEYAREALGRLSCDFIHKI